MMMMMTLFFDPTIRRLVFLVAGAFLFLSNVQAADVWPVIIDHAFGTTTVSKAPERVVTLGWSGEDAVIALGTVPVGMPYYRFFKSGIFPWSEERLGKEAPVLFRGDIDYEAIAALRPDLILGVYSGIDAIAYKRLSSIAPTVVYRSGPWAADWKEQTELAGAALGKSDEAKRLIEKTSSTLSALGASQPILKGKTFTFGTYFAGSSGVVVYLPSDPRVAALIEMGMKPAPGIAALAKANPDDSSITVGFEQIDMIDAHIVIMWYGDGARAAAEAQPLFNTLGAIKRGSYVALEDPVDVWSTSALSVLSVPYGFPRFVPRLAEAAGRVNGQ